MSRGGILAALAAAGLFGASTPLAKLLLNEVTPLLLAALLYLGSGIGLGVWLALRGGCFEARASKNLVCPKRAYLNILTTVVTASPDPRGRGEKPIPARS